MARKLKKVSEVKSAGNNNRTLALDIGTRSIIGLIMEKDENIRALAVEYLEHETRSMFDGQIHDVEAVAAEISLVKTRLQEKTGLTLTHAAVAAAGRALKTAKGQALTQRFSMQEISREEVSALELEAVQKAQEKIAQEEGNSSQGGYFCVGYSIIYYFLEDQAIQNLVGQVGGQAGVEVIATFLPRVVVDGLFSALRRAELEISYLTLEPIAALTVAVPSNMRLLNLALVDIGAGTSDIAVVKKDAVFAYAMVPMGGDEITECIANHYLLDFNTAEKIKCQLADQEQLNFLDILENRITVSAQEIIEQIQPVVREIANSIAHEIVTVNQKTPDAVICVGGGSLTPTLLKELANCLELPVNRVGIRTRETLEVIKGDFPGLTGPQAITPIGIGLNALSSRTLPFVRVRVNDRELPLWSLNEVNVAAALLASGINLNSIYGRPGLGRTVEVNGALRFFKGKMGSAPEIKVNGVPAGLDSPIKEGDRIEFSRGQDGKDASVTIRDLINEEEGLVYVNGKSFSLPPLVLVNGEEKGLDYYVPDRARIELAQGRRLSDILMLDGIEQTLLVARTFRYTLNREEIEFKWSPCRVKVNGEEVDGDPLVNFGSRIECDVRQESPILGEALNLKGLNQNIVVTVNDQKIELPVRRIELLVNGTPGSADDPLEDGTWIELKEEEYTAILSDVLQYIEINPRKPGRLIMKLNGLEAGFTNVIRDGDQVEIRWEEIS